MRKFYKYTGENRDHTICNGLVRIMVDNPKPEFIALDFAEDFHEVIAVTAKKTKGGFKIANWLELHLWHGVDAPDLDAMAASIGEYIPA